MFAIVRESLEYAERIRDLFGSSIIAHNPIWEGSGDKAYDISGHGCHGIRTAVAVAPGIRDGRFSGSFNGTTSFINWYSPALAAAWSANPFAILGWGKIPLAAWTDGTDRYIFNIQTDANNLYSLRKRTANNTLRWTALAGGVGNVVENTSAPIDWFHFALTRTGNTMTAYFNAISQGTITVAAWSGALAATTTVIGSLNTTPGSVHSGFLQHLVLLNKNATAAEIAAAYRMAFA